eukprot:CAMPEP_0171738888 /NCGR_PEP_ID=MMETSP0991-20121206/33884_1 /TAXON_ID=483369 /ORGANISM="non described non described, Strain CCMP2098" /LENGTH=426 /DNA_ID=CAMNT_0012336357 /DNA_START=137 /DNA_END=1417 /DNA_ORIENTATION=+
MDNDRLVTGRAKPCVEENTDDCLGVSVEEEEKRKKISTPLYSIAIGQLIALFIVGTGASTTLLQQYSHMNAPAAQNAPNYLILSLFLFNPYRRQVWLSNPSSLPTFIRRVLPQEHVEHVPVPTNATISPLAASPQNGGERHQEGGEDEEEDHENETGREVEDCKEGSDTIGEDQWWRYALLSVVDVEANVLCVWAYQYTSITSAMILDCFTIPCVMALSCALLGARYEMAHFAGAALCFVGVAFIVTSDVLEGEGGDEDYPNAWMGDIMCVGGAFLYAVSNVVQERWVRAAGPPRFLGRLGACGAVLSLAQALVLEREALLVHTHWNAAGLGAWAGYTTALTLAYAVTSWFLVDADAALFNLSLLTADVYAVVFAYFVQGNLVSILYAPAFCCTMAGIFVYHRAPKPTFSLSHTRTTSSFSSSNNI